MIHKWKIPDTNYTLQGAEAQPTADGADPLLLRPAWCWQDQHRKVHRSHLGQRVPQDFAWWVELLNLDTSYFFIQAGWRTSQTYEATEEHTLAGNLLVFPFRVNMDQKASHTTISHIAACPADWSREWKLQEWIIQCCFWMRWVLPTTNICWV